jgi:hypothetical protein
MYNLATGFKKKPDSSFNQSGLKHLFKKDLKFY